MRVNIKQLKKIRNIRKLYFSTSEIALICKKSIRTVEGWMIGRTIPALEMNILEKEVEKVLTSTHGAAK